MSDMKCPFCNRNLHKGEDGIYSHLDYMTECKGRLFDGSKELWQELIRTRKALEYAKDAIDVISLKYHKDTPSIFLIKYAENAKAEITALEQKESAFVNNKIKFPEYNDNLLEEFDKQFFENGQDDDLTETALEQKEVK